MIPFPLEVKPRKPLDLLPLSTDVTIFGAIRMIETHG